MAILQGKEILNPFIHKAGGYVKSLLSSNHVEMNDGNTLQNAMDHMLDKIYPVGSIYLSINAANPNTYLGGTWVAWGGGRVPVGVDTSQAEFSTVQKTGGSKTHKLTSNEMPSHYGHVPSDGEQWNVGNTARYMDIAKLTAYGSSGRGWSIFAGNEVIPGGVNRGGNAAHNNLQPYITCYMWLRTA